MNVKKIKRIRIANTIISSQYKFQLYSKLHFFIKYIKRLYILKIYSKMEIFISICIGIFVGVEIGILIIIFEYFANVISNIEI